MPGQPPLFSIVVPTYNRLPQLKRTLESLWSLDYPQYEIIIVSDGSTDGTDEYLHSLSKTGRVIFATQWNQGPAMARNTGISLAHGDYIAFTDDDCIVPKDWLKRYDGEFTRNPAAGLGGAAQTGNASNLFAVANDLTANILKEEINSRNDAGTPFLTSNNAVYKKSSLDAVGGFHKDFKRGAEERDLNVRLSLAGHSLRYIPAIVIDHYNNENFTGYFKHQFEQGQGSYLLYRNYRVLTGRKQSSIRIPVYLRLFIAPFKGHKLLSAITLSILLMTTQGVILAGYLSATLKANNRS